VVASATKRFFGPADQGPAEDNRLELTMLGTTMSSNFYDLDIAAAGVFVPDEIAGTNNTVRLLIRGASGSGQPNWYGVAYGPPFFLELPPELWGTGNRVEVVGSRRAFEAANPGVDPPPTAWFTAADQLRQ
jgi:hypothetical protein